MEHLYQPQTPKAQGPWGGIGKLWGADFQTWHDLCTGGTCSSSDGEIKQVRVLAWVGRVPRGSSRLLEEVSLSLGMWPLVDYFCSSGWPHAMNLYKAVAGLCLIIFFKKNEARRAVCWGSLSRESQRGEVISGHDWNNCLRVWNPQQMN